MPAGSIIDYEAIRAAEVHRVPYDWMTGKGALRAEWIPALRESFPDIKVTGFHPLSQMKVDGAFAQLIEEMEGPEFTRAASQALGVDLSPYPTLITVRKVSAAHEGNIHCDSESKIATLLIYMNEGWLSPEGRFRVLRSEKDFSDYEAEVSPEMGSFVAFRRAGQSWHGHTPFVGERRVVQIAWVRSQAEIDRKTKRHNRSSFFKKLFRREKAAA
ncbi:MAG: 2OG-Fe(II) oxygenase [Alphaproteobacteria bacterium]|nr:2OG-Fe(II) oxygenase [Alphaproteobacteria bacterium]